MTKTNKYAILKGVHKERRKGEIMPSYISHAIFGQELRKEYLEYNKNNLVDSEYMTQYTLALDLSRFTNSYKKTHQRKTRDFLMTMINYIKDNRLEHDAKALGVLFGHISHYFLDTNIHPLVYYNSEGCEAVGLISPHTFIEGLLDQELRQEKKVGFKRYLKNIRTNEQQYNEIISYTYDKVYHEKKILSSIKKSLIMLAGLEKFTNNTPKEILVRFSGFKEFLDINKLSKEEILNNCHGIWQNPVTGVKCNKSMRELYHDALSQTMDAMRVISNYFNNLISCDQVERLFNNLSYDTGVDLNLGQQMVYTRKRVRK